MGKKLLLEAGSGAVTKIDIDAVIVGKRWLIQQ